MDDQTASSLTYCTDKTSITFKNGTLLEYWIDEGDITFDIKHGGIFMHFDIQFIDLYAALKLEINEKFSQNVVRGVLCILRVARTNDDVKIETASVGMSAGIVIPYDEFKQVFTKIALAYVKYALDNKREIDYDAMVVTNKGGVVLINDIAKFNAIADELQKSAV